MIISSIILSMTMLSFAYSSTNNHTTFTIQNQVEAEIIHGEEVIKFGIRVGYKIKIYFVNNSNASLVTKYSIYLGDEDLDTTSLPQAWLQMRRVMKNGYRIYSTSDTIYLGPKEEKVITMTIGIDWTPRSSQEDIVIEKISVNY